MHYCTFIIYRRHLKLGFLVSNNDTKSDLKIKWVVLSRPKHTIVICAWFRVNTAFGAVSRPRATQRTRFLGPTWGPPGPCRPQMDPMLASWILLSGNTYKKQFSHLCPHVPNDVNTDQEQSTKVTIPHFVDDAHVMYGVILWNIWSYSWIWQSRREDLIENSKQ